ncbi:unnamed protein product, partial [Rotaria sordida]
TLLPHHPDLAVGYNNIGGCVGESDFSLIPSDFSLIPSDFSLIPSDFFI